LVELRQAQRVGALDDQRVRLRDVDARLDDRRRHEDVGIAAQERVHLLLELTLAHLPVRGDEAQVRAELLQLQHDLLDRLDAIVEIERLAPARMLTLQCRCYEVLVELSDNSSDRATAHRRRLDDRDVAEPRKRHVQRARNRRGRERKHVDLEP
jgi:hypothetical protein